MWERIIDEIKNNLRNPNLYIVLIIVIMVFLLLFPYIDANIFYYNRVNSRIEILNKMSEIDVEKIQNNEIFMKEYNSILDEIEKQTEGNMGNIFMHENDEKVDTIKFISGGMVFWGIAISYLYGENRNLKNIKYGFFPMIIIGFIFGVIARQIPTIISPIINFIGFPILILGIMILFYINSTKS